MLKLKNIIVIIFLLAIQQVSAIPSDDIRLNSGDNSNIEISFKANDSFPGIYGDVPSGRVAVNLSFCVTDCDPGISKSKDVLSGLTFSTSKSNLQFFNFQSAVFTRHSAVYIPIYLQTATFRL